MTFGYRLRIARTVKKLTQKQLADLIGAKHNSISDWENNKNKPDPDTIELLCGVLEITPNYLIGGNAITDDLTPIEREHIKKYRTLNSHGKEMVDFVLIKEWECSTFEKRDTKICEYELYDRASSVAEKDSYNMDAAHTRTDIEVTEEMIQHDDDIMDDENF